MKKIYVLPARKRTPSENEFFTISEAIRSVPENNEEPVTIVVRQGIYKEKLVINRPNITLLGEGKVVITYDDYAAKLMENGENYGTFRSYTVLVDTNDFTAKNIVFENSSGPVGQALALYAEGDRLYFDHCSFLGYQDTIFTGPLPPSARIPGGFRGPKEFSKRINGRQCFYKCYISGSTDFIFGCATAYFEECEIVSRRPGYITAASTPEGQEYGYVFHKCCLRAAEFSECGKGWEECPEKSVYLGRPWREYARTVFLNCEMRAHIKVEGWHDWDKPEAHNTIYYAEYNSMGPGGIDNGKWKQRAPFSRIISEEEAKHYTRTRVLGERDGWDPVPSNASWVPDLQEYRITFDTEIPYHDRDGRGYGFVEENCGLPTRKVQLSKLFKKDNSICVVENEKERFASYNETGTDYDFGGMIFRIDLSPGTYCFEVECTGGEETTLVSLSGMHPYRIRHNEYWDAARLVPVRNQAVWNGNVWSYSFVNGLPYVDIELEPLKPGIVVGMKAIRIYKAELQTAEKPTIFILGDSTAKSYVFEEAPMSGWGQCFYRMVDASKVAVVNYANGGRSLKTMYIEGRLNDMLLSGKRGDFVLLQSGQNDERSRNDGIDPDGELIRYGGGSTEEMYYEFLTKRFLPAIRARGMIPVLVSPVTRIDARCADDNVFEDSFTNRRFPIVMRRAAEDMGVLFLDLNKRSVEHFNQIGAAAARAIVMTLEPGETPGRTKDGSYANGNPGNHADGTHYKEALSRQYCRLLTEEIARMSKEGNKVAEMLWELLAQKVKKAAETMNYEEVFPEICRDTITGSGAYYRNQIEKMVQVGVFLKDEKGCFYPERDYTIEEFRAALAKIWRLPDKFTCFESNGKLRRRDAAEILYDAYYTRFGEGENRKPQYMKETFSDGETGYYPTVAFDELQDVDGLEPELLHKIKTVYQLGMMRSEAGISRGSLENGVLFQPETIITRGKAAKLLYFCFVLDKDTKAENHVV